MDQNVPPKDYNLDDLQDSLQVGASSNDDSDNDQSVFRAANNLNAVFQIMSKEAIIEPELQFSIPVADPKEIDFVQNALNHALTLNPDTLYMHHECLLQFRFRFDFVKFIYENALAFLLVVRISLS